MADLGYAYVPKNCQVANNDCHIHVAIHGCRQNVMDIDMAWVELSGYGEVAETNDFIILYPDAKKLTLSNPRGCWDWWGYTENSSIMKPGKLYATNKGVQMMEIKRQIDAIRTGDLELTPVKHLVSE